MLRAAPWHPSTFFFAIDEHPAQLAALLRAGPIGADWFHRGRGATGKGKGGKGKGRPPPDELQCQYDVLQKHRFLVAGRTGLTRKMLDLQFVRGEDESDCGALWVVEVCFNNNFCGMMSIAVAVCDCKRFATSAFSKNLDDFVGALDTHAVRAIGGEFHDEVHNVLSSLRNHFQVRLSALDPFYTLKGNLRYASSAILTLGPVVTGHIYSKKVDADMLETRKPGCSHPVTMGVPEQTFWSKFLTEANPPNADDTFTGTTSIDRSKGWTPIIRVKQKKVERPVELTQKLSIYLEGTEARRTKESADRRLDRAYTRTGGQHGQKSKKAATWENCGKTA